MARLVTKFKYLKPDQEKPIGGYATYIATREGVEKIDESFKLAPATVKQQKLIEKILGDFPDSATMLEYEDYKRLQHLSALKPEMCSFDPNTLNWANSYIFENSPRFLNKLAEEVVKEDVKPEFEIFDTGHLDSAMYYVNKHGIPGNPHMQFIMGVGGSMPGTAENLDFMVGHLPKGATWSVSGIGKAHMPMMLAGLALGCDGLRVGLEDNIR